MKPVSQLISLAINDIVLDVHFVFNQKEIVITNINHNGENISALLSKETVYEIMKLLKLQRKEYDR